MMNGMLQQFSASVEYHAYRLPCNASVAAEETHFREHIYYRHIYSVEIYFIMSKSANISTSKAVAFVRINKGIETLWRFGLLEPGSRSFERAVRTRISSELPVYISVALLLRVFFLP